MTVLQNRGSSRKAEKAQEQAVEGVARGAARALQRAGWSDERVLGGRDYGRRQVARDWDARRMPSCLGLGLGCMHAVSGRGLGC